MTIWHWERGENTPRAAKMKTLADALGVSPEYLELGSLDEPVICDAPQAGPQLLSDILDHVKRYIAQATGIDSDQITIMIDY